MSNSSFLQTATEHYMAERLVVDDIVHWAKHYKVSHVRAERAQLCGPGCYGSDMGAPTKKPPTLHAPLGDLLDIQACQSCALCPGIFTTLTFFSSSAGVCAD
jgi:hypothetical protein